MTDFADHVPVADLRAQAELLAAAAVRAGALASADLARLQPGIASHVPDTAEGWLGFLIQLHRQHAVRVAREDASEAAGAGGGPGPLDRRILEALAELPRDVILLVPPASEPARRILQVYPKSWIALAHMWDRDHAIAWLVDVHYALLAAPEPPDYDLVQQCTAETCYQQACQIWTLTTPGPGLPWDETDHGPHAIPAWILELDARDVLQLQIVAHELNNEALRALSGLKVSTTATDRAPKPLPWATFFGAVADQLGIPASQLLRDRSVLAVVAQARAAAAGSAVPDKAA